MAPRTRAVVARKARSVTSLVAGATLVAAVFLPAGSLSTAEAAKHQDEANTEQGEGKTTSTLTLDDLQIVDCMIPGRVVKQGRHSTYLTPPRPIRTTSEDCAIRGGKQVVDDPATYGARLKVWRAEAEAGNSEAQLFLAKMYQQGLGTPIDDEQAASWYRKAADAGNKEAMIRLGEMYVKGSGGLPQDLLAAAEWYQKASGLTGKVVLDVDLQAMEERLLQAEAQVADSAEQLAALNAMLESARKQGDASKEQVQALEKTVGKLRADIDQHKRQIDQLKAQRTAIDNAPAGIELAPPRIEVLSGFRETTGTYVGKVEAQAGLQSLTVDGAPKTWDQTGIFKFQIGSANRSRLEAVDRRGRKTTLSYEVRISDADGTPVEIPSRALPDVPLGRFYALLIGNSKYQKLPPLQTPASDVAAIASVLGARYGFTTTTLFDATNLDITRALNDMAKRLTKDDNLIIYFAGHGAINGERGYWLPVDASEGSDKNWVAAQTVTDWAQKLINARRILIVADSCYSGTLTVNSLPPPPGGSEKEQKQWMRKVSERRSRIALTSGAVSPVLDAGEKGHSIFASAVLHELQQNSGTMTTRQLWSAVEALVAYKTLALGAKQRPQYAPIDGHEGGEFFFKKV